MAPRRTTPAPDGPVQRIVALLEGGPFDGQQFSVALVKGRAPVIDTLPGLDDGHVYKAAGRRSKDVNDAHLDAFPGQEGHLVGVQRYTYVKRKK